LLISDKRIVVNGGSRNKEGLNQNLGLEFGEDEFGNPIE
jgi:hypothetical protein